MVTAGVVSSHAPRPRAKALADAPVPDALVPGPTTAADPVLHFLARPGSHLGHAGHVHRVDVRETHMSWLFLAGDSVLKLKKAVQLDVLDFSTLARREAACRAELSVNQALAPGIYLGLMRLQRGARGLSLVAEADADPQAATVDWLVHMRRLPDACMLDHMIAARRVRPAHVDVLAQVLCAFYRRTRLVVLDADTYVSRMLQEQAADRAVLLNPAWRLPGAEQALDRFVRAVHRHADALGARAAGGHVVDGHGDLRPEHVGLLAPPVVIDRLEFNPRLREVDPFDELGFLGMECARLGAAWIGPQLVGACGAALGDRPSPAVQALHVAARALLRARLALAHLQDPQPRSPGRWRPLAQQYLGRASAALDTLGV